MIRKILLGNFDKNYSLKKKKLIESRSILEKNIMLIKMLYKHDNLLLDNKNNLNLKNYDYY